MFQGYLTLIWVDDDKENNVIVKEWNEVNIPIVYNIFSKWEM